MMATELSETAILFKNVLPRGLPLSPLPAPYVRDPTVSHAPIRTPNLSPEEEVLAV